MIIFNKWILAYSGFPFPISLTMWHMGFSSILSFALVKGGVTPGVNMNQATYLKAVVPIGALFAGGHP